MNRKKWYSIQAKDVENITLTNFSHRPKFVIIVSHTPQDVKLPLGIYRVSHETIARRLESLLWYLNLFVTFSLLSTLTCMILETIIT